MFNKITYNEFRKKLKTLEESVRAVRSIKINLITPDTINVTMESMTWISQRQVDDFRDAYCTLSNAWKLWLGMDKMPECHYIPRDNGGSCSINYPISAFKDFSPKDATRKFIANFLQDELKAFLAIDTHTYIGLKGRSMIEISIYDSHGYPYQELLLQRLKIFAIKYGMKATGKIVIDEKKDPKPGDAFMAHVKFSITSFIKSQGAQELTEMFPCLNINLLTNHEA